MNVFISYSTEDLVSVERIAKAIKDCEDEPFWWHEKKLPGRGAWDTIFGWIEGADVVIAVITDRTLARAMAVGNEIGYAKAHNKPIIPVLGKGIKPESLGCLLGITHVQLGKERLRDSINEVLGALDAVEGATPNKRRMYLLLAAIKAAAEGRT